MILLLKVTCCYAVSMLLAAAPAWSINKCTQKDGKVVYQDAPCQNSATSNEQVKTWGAGQAAPSAGGTTSAGFKRVNPNASLQGPPEAAALLAVYRRWADAERLASATGRIALAGPVATMQAVQLEAEALRVDACLADAKAALVDLTSKSTTALIEFMRRNEVHSFLYSVADRGDLVRTFESHIERASCEARSAGK